MEKISTSRLVLRNFSVDDAEALLGYLSNPRVNCFLSGKITTEKEAKSEAEKKSKDDSHIAVSLKDNDYVIGELFYVYEEPDTYFVGWNFNAEYEGKGYASESARTLFRYLFEEKGARRLYAYVEDDNYRSQKLSEKLGMRKEGCFWSLFLSLNTKMKRLNMKIHSNMPYLKKNGKNRKKLSAHSTRLFNLSVVILTFY